MKVVIAVMLLVAATAMFAYAALSHAWWSHESTGFGLLSLESCGSRCETTSYGAIDPPNPGFLWAGRITFATSLAAAVAIAGTLVAMFLGRDRLIDKGIARALSVVAGLGALVFVKTAPPSLDDLSGGAPLYVTLSAVLLACIGELFASEAASARRVA